MPRAVDDVAALGRRCFWPPYTASEAHDAGDAFLVAGAEGPYLIDTEGRRWLDGSGSWWCSNLGHGHPRVRAALKAQADRWMHSMVGGLGHAPAYELARDLVEIAPAGLTRVFYSDDGSTAVEVAAKMAFQYWHQNGRPERTRFAALPGGYHGDTLGTMSLGAVDAFSALFAPLMFGASRPPDPADSGGWERTFEALFALIRAERDAIAAVVVEPVVQGAAGMRMYPPALLAELRAVADEVDTFLIFDEVFTGFGRTGPMWACEPAGVAPDLLCSAKGLSAGALPFAATLATERIYDGFRGGKARSLMHGHTFCGNPLGAAVAREVLAIYRDEAILERAAPRARQLAEGFERIGRIESADRAALKTADALFATEFRPFLPDEF